MMDPKRQEQISQLKKIETCVSVLQSARNELYMHMHYFDIALSSLGFEAVYDTKSIGTDGYLIYYHPDTLLSVYRNGRIRLNRIYLHMILHCLFGHLDGKGNREDLLYYLACDIAVESIVDGMFATCIHKTPSAYRMEFYQRLRRKKAVLNAESIYHQLVEWNLEPGRINRLFEEFFQDDHGYWPLEESNPKASVERQNKWSDQRDKTQMKVESHGDERKEGQNQLLEQMQLEGHSKYDYRDFLRKFSIWKEIVQVDEDSFDYGLYSHGLSLYGNIPLLEPLETREVKGIEDFVIVVDTSMSCSGALIKRFLEETYHILRERESFFQKVHIHMIQCDEAVTEDQLITNQEEMEAYMKDFSVVGYGGTDFRPAFEYVNQMVKRRVFKKLKGLIYFTDGEGIFPVRRPVYETAFVFMKDYYTDVSVPPWAMKVILEQDN